MHHKPNNLALSVECCQNCFEHPLPFPHPQSQSTYSTALTELQVELTRCLYECQVVINKNEGNIKPRLGAFEVKYKGLLVFSKIMQGKFCKNCDLVNIVVALQRRNKFELHKINNKLGTRDLYGWLRQKTQTVKLSYKFISDQIDKIVNVAIVQLKSTIKKLNNTKSIAHKQNIPVSCPRRNLQSSLSCRNPKAPSPMPGFQTTRIQTASASSRKGKNMPASALSKKLLSQASQVAECETQGDVHIIPKSNKSKRTQNTLIRSSMRESKFGGRVSVVQNKECKIEKYSYLSKQMDVNYDHGNKGSESTILMHSQKYGYRRSNVAHEHHEDFQILSLSEDSNECADNNKIWDEDKLQQRRIEQGLNFNLTATYNDTRSSHRCSFQYKKLAEMLELELKQDQVGHQAQPGQSDNILEQKSSNEISNKQSTPGVEKQARNLLRTSFPESQACSNSSIEKDDLLATPSVYVITERDLMSKRHITWIPNQREQQDEEYKKQQVVQQQQIVGLSFQNIEIASQSRIFIGSENAEQQTEQDAQLRIQTVQQYFNNTIKLFVQNWRQTQLIICFDQLGNTASRITQKVYYRTCYQQGFVNPLITGMPNPTQQTLIFDNPSKMIKQEVSLIVSYIHNKFPMLFPALFNCQNSFHSLQAFSEMHKHQSDGTIHKICLFDLKYGNLSNKYIKSTRSASWQSVISSTISSMLRSEQRICQVMRMLTGAPVVRISAVDLRKIKRIVVDGHFQAEPAQRKGVVLGVHDNGWEFCQIVDIKKNSKDLLQSMVTYIPIDHSHNQKESISKVYEQFVLDYQHLMMWLINPVFHHNQTTIQNSFTNGGESIHKHWKLYLDLKLGTQLFFEFTQHEKQQKSNRILICKLENDQSNSGSMVDLKNIQIAETIGELNKKGNFFFELTLESGMYLVQIQRSFEIQQSNTVHLYSSNSIEIMDSFIQ